MCIRDSFRSLKAYGWSGVNQTRLWRQDKGQKACTAAFVNAIETGNTGDLIAFDELVEVASACFDVVDQISA